MSIINNAIEVAHRRTRRREKIFGRPKSHRHAQRYLSVYGPDQPHIPPTPPSTHCTFLSPFSRWCLPTLGGLLMRNDCLKTIQLLLWPPHANKLAIPVWCFHIGYLISMKIDTSFPRLKSYLFPREVIALRGLGLLSLYAEFWRCRGFTGWTWHHR